MPLPPDNYTPHGYLDIPSHTRNLSPRGVLRSYEAGFRWHYPAFPGMYGGRRETYRAGLRIGLDGALATGAVKGLAHITGGGLPENVPRILPGDVDAEIRLGSWPVSPLFRLVAELATGLDAHELHRTLNMGIGMVVVAAAHDVERVQAAIAEDTWVIGELVAHDPTAPRVRLLA